MIRALIIDDEAKSISVLRTLLFELESSIEVVGTCGTVTEGLNLISQTKPDLVFMDVALQDGNCFQILDSCNCHSFQIIFISAHSEFLFKAFQYQSVDYLLKPIAVDDLAAAISRVQVPKLD